MDPVASSPADPLSDSKELTACREAWAAYERYNGSDSGAALLALTTATSLALGGSKQSVVDILPNNPDLSPYPASVNMEVLMARFGETIYRTTEPVTRNGQLQQQQQPPPATETVRSTLDRLESGMACLREARATIDDHQWTLYDDAYMKLFNSYAYILQTTIEICKAYVDMTTQPVLPYSERLHRMTRALFMISDLRGTTNAYGTSGWLSSSLERPSGVEELMDAIVTVSTILFLQTSVTGERGEALLADIRAIEPFYQHLDDPDDTVPQTGSTLQRVRPQARSTSMFRSRRRI